MIFLTLIELGNNQPLKPLHTDNSKELLIVNNTVNLKISISINLKYLWLIDQVYQHIFQ